MRKLVLLAVIAALLTGCNAINTLTDGYKHAQEVASDLEKSVGVKPLVGFNWMNGSLASVTVNFHGVPPWKTNEEIAAMARSSIQTRFRQLPQTIVISFTLPGGAPPTQASPGGGELRRQ